MRDFIAEAREFIHKNTGMISPTERVLHNVVQCTECNQGADLTSHKIGEFWYNASTYHCPHCGALGDTYTANFHGGKKEPD